MTNTTPTTNQTSLSQSVDKLVHDFQSSLGEYRETVADKIVAELDIPNNVAAIKSLVQKKLQQRNTPDYVESIGNLDFGSGSLRLASQRILQLPCSYSTDTTSAHPLQITGRTSVISQPNSILDNDGDDDASSNLVADKILEVLKQPKPKS
jgi:hypothetical protein